VTATSSGTKVSVGNLTLRRGRVISDQRRSRRFPHLSEASGIGARRDRRGEATRHSAGGQEVEAGITSKVTGGGSRSLECTDGDPATTVEWCEGSRLARRRAAGAAPPASITRCSKAATGRRRDGAASTPAVPGDRKGTRRRPYARFERTAELRDFVRPCRRCGNIAEAGPEWRRSADLPG
jgi:hypothetical protein